jgi:hypothetical protein
MQKGSKVLTSMWGCIVQGQGKGKGPLLFNSNFWCLELPMYTHQHLCTFFFLFLIFFNMKSIPKVKYPFPLSNTNHVVPNELRTHNHFVKGQMQETLWLDFTHYIQMRLKYIFFSHMYYHAIINPLGPLVSVLCKIQGVAILALHNIIKLN